MFDNKMEACCVAVGAVGGALLRWKTISVAKDFGLAPMSVLGINVLGSFALGAVAAKTKSLPPKASLLLGTGFCGSFTTFSTFSVDVINYLEKGNYGKAALYISSTNLLSIGAAVLAYKTLRR